MTLLDDPVAVAAAPLTPAPAHRRWERYALLALLAATAVLYMWGLGSLGWANNFYAAAVQAGTQDLKAFLFGSLDPGNAITVDKPPASLWIMVLSARLFGFSAFSMLLPEALMGVGAVALLFVTVRRCSGPAAGLIAGTVLALTPVAALMFRYNQPDALLTLLLTAAAYFMVRAIESGSTRWIALAGTVIGFAFLTKMLQAALVVPGIALVFLLAAPGRLSKRVWQLLVGVAAIVVSAGWFIALVSLWPARSRPYIGGSTDNSLLQLALGYNGIERVAGAGGNPGGDNPMFGGPSGIGRSFALSMGTEHLLAAPGRADRPLSPWCLVHREQPARRTAPRPPSAVGRLATGQRRGVQFHARRHPPLLHGRAGTGDRRVDRHFGSRAMAGPRIPGSRTVLAAMSAATGVWAFILLDRTPTWPPALRWIVLIGSIAVASVIAVGAHRLGRSTAAVAAAALLFGVGAPAAYTIDTVGSPHAGGIPTSGPAAAAFGPGPGGPGSGGPPRGRDADNSTAALLRGDETRWAAATVGSMGASSLELQTGASVMAIGGFIGSDDSPTLRQFQKYVNDQQIHYFVADGMAGLPDNRSPTAADITAWVQQHFPPTDVGGTTVYDLSSPAN